MQSEAYVRLKVCELYLCSRGFGRLKLDVPWQAQHGSHPNWAASLLGRRMASAISNSVFRFAATARHHLPVNTWVQAMNSGKLVMGRCLGEFHLHGEIGWLLDGSIHMKGREPSF